MFKDFPTNLHQESWHPGTVCALLSNQVESTYSTASIRRCSTEHAPRMTIGDPGACTSSTAEQPKCLLSSCKEYDASTFSCTNKGITVQFSVHVSSRWSYLNPSEFEREEKHYL